MDVPAPSQPPEFQGLSASPPQASTTPSCLTAAQWDHAFYKTAEFNQWDELEMAAPWQAGDHVSLLLPAPSPQPVP